jgi:Xaa-Pro aminopeptidase
MVSSVEPGLYMEGYGGMRLEENLVFTEDGVELLGSFDTSL